MRYEDALVAISALGPRVFSGGLDRMREFVAAAGLEQALTEIGYVHVAGTNGKGSTTAYLQSMMCEEVGPEKVGAFFSPYVFDPRERVQMGRDLITREDFARLTAKLLAIDVPISEFEFKTALGFAAWLEKRVEWVALEVGLGGRLDATNVVSARAGAIVSIGLDHVNILGDTLEKIALEKAGIAKPGMPMVVGGLVPEAMAAVERKCAEVGAPLWRLGREVLLEPGWKVITPVGAFEGLTPGMEGAKQPENMAVAVAAWAAAGMARDADAVRRGVEMARAPGRFEIRSWRGKTIVLDGAHNGEAAAVLRASLEKRFPGQKLGLVTGMVQGHDAGRFYESLLPLMSRVAFAPIDSPRARSPHDLLSELAIPIAKAFESVEEALKFAAEGTDVVVITGSFYLLGSVNPLISS